MLLSQVLQYNPDSDEWEDLGDLQTVREYAEVIEIPGTDLTNFDNNYK